MVSRHKKLWDGADDKLPNGKVYSPAGFQFWPAANAIYRRETYDNYPGARYLLRSVVEGLQLPMDLALQVESRYFAKVLQAPEAANMIRSLFVSMQELNKLARRPVDQRPNKIRKIGILGAGFMGAGIAYVTAQAGIDVVLIDRDGEEYAPGQVKFDTGPEANRPSQFEIRPPPPVDITPSRKRVFLPSSKSGILELPDPFEDDARPDFGLDGGSE